MLFSEDLLLANLIMLCLGPGLGLCVLSSLATQDLELTMEMSSVAAPSQWESERSKEQFGQAHLTS